MARAETTDFMQNNRFHVVEQGNFLDPVAGFQTATLPELSVEEIEYKEGIDSFTRKYPGNPEFDTITLEKGVVRNGTDFFDWVIKSALGGEYRTDLAIWTFHRSDPKGISDGAPSRIYRLYEAFAVRVKPAGDLDATSADVSLAELDIAFESFDIELSNRNA